MTVSKVGWLVGIDEGTGTFVGVDMELVLGIDVGIADVGVDDGAFSSFSHSTSQTCRVYRTGFPSASKTGRGCE